MIISLHDPSTYLVAGAVVGLAVMAVGLVVLVFRRNIQADALAEMVKKLVLANNVDRAIKLCHAADCPATTLTLYLLGTQEPAEVLEQGQEQQRAGYRDAAASVRQVPFAERVAARADREVRALERSQVRSWGLAALLGGLAAFSLGVAAWFVAGPGINWLAAVSAFGLLGAMHGARVWWRIGRGLRRIAATVAPLLRPVEKMDKERQVAAARAYEAYRRRRGLPTESSPSWFER